MNTSRILEKGIEPKVFWGRLCGEISSYRSCEDVYFFHKDNQGQVLLLGKSESAQVIDLPEVVRKKISGNQSNSEIVQCGTRRFILVSDYVRFNSRTEGVRSIENV